MTPIQQLMLGVGAKKKVFLDEVFSTYVYEGTGSARSINNGINLSGEGGMTWIKSREESEWHHIFDTVRGAGKGVFSNSYVAEITDTTRLSSFNNNGFSLGTDYRANKNDIDFSSWTFRKAPGFFDVVTYTGTGSAQNVSHSLGSIPGMILIKQTDGTESWRVYHRSNGAGKFLYLNGTNTVGTSSAYWNDTEPTASVFSVGTHDSVNQNTKTYVAYLFAGGESTAATARSVTFDASGDYLTSNTNANLSMGTGDYTVEGWFRLRGSSFSTATGSEGCGLFMNSPSSQGLHTDYGGHIFAYLWDDGSFHLGNAGDIGGPPPKDQWFHIAMTRSGTTLRAFYNGILKKTVTNSTDHTGQNWAIGGYYSTNYLMEGDVSNFRVVKGTAVYTSSFRPTTAPLTSISGTSLLCCNGSTVTSATTGSVTSSGDPTASTDSPFDDPDGFAFGDAGDQNVIKCGSYVGNGSNLQDVFLGFEPQWVMIKCSSNSTTHTNWAIYDSMRGVVSGGNDRQLVANDSDAEESGDNYANSDLIEFTSTGFKVGQSGWDVNHNANETYIYMAIRRPDGYVGKPAEAGTNVFGMSTGTSDSSIPLFSGSFPVDFSLHRAWASSSTWYTGARLMQGKYLRADTNDAEATHAPINYAFNAGWNSQDVDASASQSWQWKRHAGFDVVAYKGDGVAGHQIPHSLNKTAEMMWVKRRDGAQDWMVYHNNLNSGTTPHNWFLKLNATTVESENSNRFGGAPTSTHFTVGTDGDTNGSGNDYIAMLFASVDGISKVGSYDGSNSSQTITTGFQPRFLIIKRVDATYAWYVLDTTRGWGSGNDSQLELQNSNAALSHDFGAPTSTGFTLTSFDSYNISGGKFIYYAHA